MHGLNKTYPTFVWENFILLDCDEIDKVDF